MPTEMSAGGALFQPSFCLVVSMLLFFHFKLVKDVCQQLLEAHHTFDHAAFDRFVSSTRLPIA